jgi:hypothetical protein
MKQNYKLDQGANQKLPILATFGNMDLPIWQDGGPRLPLHHVTRWRLSSYTCWTSSEQNSVLLIAWFPSESTQLTACISIK